MGLNPSPAEVEKPEFPSPVYIRGEGGGCLGVILLIIFLVGFMFMFVFGTHLASLEQKKYDNFVGKKVVIKLSGMEGFIDEAPTVGHWLSFNHSHWGVQYVDKSGNIQRIYCTNDEIELKE